MKGAGKVHERYMIDDVRRQPALASLSCRQDPNTPVVVPAQNNLSFCRFQNLKSRGYRGYRGHPFRFASMSAGVGALHQILFSKPMHPRLPPCFQLPPSNQDHRLPGFEPSRYPVASAPHRQFLPVACPVSTRGLNSQYSTRSDRDQIDTPEQVATMTMTDKRARMDIPLHRAHRVPLLSQPTHRSLRRRQFSHVLRFFP